MPKKATPPDLITDTMSPELEAWLVAHSPTLRRDLPRRRNGSLERVNASLTRLAAQNEWPSAQQIGKHGDLQTVIIEGESDDATINS